MTGAEQVCNAGEWPYKGIEAEEGCQAQERVLLLHIIPHRAQSIAPGTDEVLQVGGYGLWADPCYAPQRYRAAHRSYSGQQD